MKSFENKVLKITRIQNYQKQYSLYSVFILIYSCKETLACIIPLRETGGGTAASNWKGLPARLSWEYVSL